MDRLDGLVTLDRRYPGPGSRSGLMLLVLAMASCAKSEPSYFPLREGLYRQYQITVQTMVLEKQSKYVVQTLAPRALGGRRVVPEAINGETVYFYSRTPAGVHRVATRRMQADEAGTDDSERLVLPATLEIGSTWEQDTMTAVLETLVTPFRRLYRLEVPVTMRYTVESLNDEVRVPAGTFHDCLKVRGVGSTAHEGDPAIRKADVDVEHIDWYAPGVGLVKTFRRETTTNKNLKQGELRMELEVLKRP